MPVNLIPRIVNGWKEGPNNRFGKCLVVQFKNSKDGKQLFEYAPTLLEIDFWLDIFGKLKRLDALHKEAIGLMKEIDPQFTAGKVDGCEVKEI